MPSPVPAPRVPVAPNIPVPVLAPKAVPVPNAVGLALNRLPAVPVGAPNALVPKPVALAPKLNPVWGLFCAPNNPPVVPAPSVARKQG